MYMYINFGHFTHINLIASKQGLKLILKAPIMTAADDIHKFFFCCFSEKIRLDVSSESSARQRIHMKNQALFSLKDKSKKLKCRLLQFLFGALRIKTKHERKSRGEGA